VLVRKLGDYCEQTSRRLDSIELALSGGAPSSPDALARFARAISPTGEVFTPYGATESLPVSNIGTSEILAEAAEKTRQGAGVCVGRLMPGITAAIIPISESPIADWSEVRPLPPGEIGEICVSGPVVSAAYDNNPAANRASKIPSRATGAFYHRIGDLGYFDSEGRLWMCGRKAHRVVAAERDYFSTPVEGVFNAHPQVARTALASVGEPGQATPVLCVELRAPASASTKARIESELRALGAAHGHTRTIRHFLFHKGFPVDARHNSKIRREDLSFWAAKQLKGKPLKAPILKEKPLKEVSR
jgi:acyl-CoA synthetase (AMP-forming)/AMP-acid ligase II